MRSPNTPELKRSLQARTVHRLDKWFSRESLFPSEQVSGERADKQQKTFMTELSSSQPGTGGTAPCPPVVSEALRGTPTPDEDTLHPPPSSIGTARQSPNPAQ